MPTVRLVLVNIGFLVGGLGISSALMVLAFLSRKLGEAWGVGHAYRWLYPATIAMVVSAIGVILLMVQARHRVSAGLLMPWLAVYAAGGTLSVLVASRYWWWLWGQLMEPKESRENDRD